MLDEAGSPLFYKRETEDSERLSYSGRTAGEDKSRSFTPGSSKPARVLLTPVLFCPGVCL